MEVNFCNDYYYDFNWLGNKFIVVTLIDLVNTVC